MNSSQLDNILHNNRYSCLYFKGTYPLDCIPASLPATYSLILNLDKSALPGSHWFALFARHRNCYVFDSFGGIPKGIRGFLRRFEKVYYNKTSIQSDLEINCGGYSCFFIIQMSKGVPFKKVLDTFKREPKDDKFIRRFLRTECGVALPSLSK